MSKIHPQPKEQSLNPLHSHRYSAYEPNYLQPRTRSHPASATASTNALTPPTRPASPQSVCYPDSHAAFEDVSWVEVEREEVEGDKGGKKKGKGPRVDEGGMGESGNVERGEMREEEGEEGRKRKMGKGCLCLGGVVLIGIVSRICCGGAEKGGGGRKGKGRERGVEDEEEEERGHPAFR